MYCSRCLTIQQRSILFKTTTIHVRTSNILTATKPHTRLLSSSTTTNMPLVVPGLQSKDGDKSSGWMEKLVGKKIGDTSNETVSLTNMFPSHAPEKLTRWPDFRKEGSPLAAPRGQGG
jgi:hypothetical protein